MHPVKEAILNETRRQFFGQVAKGIGGLALSNLMADRTPRRLAAYQHCLTSHQKQSGVFISI